MARSTQSGFTLFELAIVLLIAGVIAAASAQLALPLMRETHIIATQTKMDRIAKAIDFYATQNYRVPCPAKPLTSTTNPPFGFEQGSGANGDTVPTDCSGAKLPTGGYVGIVPFQTLGIPVDWIRDGWGNYFTYAISPAFSENTSTVAPFPVHARCRTADWYSSPIESGDTTGTISPYEHKNPAKAMFCCPYPNNFQPSTDLIILDVNGNPQLAVSRASGLVNPASTAPISTPYLTSAATNYLIMPNVEPANTDRPTAPVYVLVSHGANGLGAYNVTTGARTPTTGATVDEAKNASDTGTFYEIPPLDRTSTAPGGSEMTFDDFVLWRTQDMIFASQGKTCAAP